MSPLEVINDDALSTMIRFETSTIYEMMISLHTLLQPRRRSAWANQTRSQLPADFWDELTAVYEICHMGAELIELPVDYPQPHNVPGFIRYVRHMDPVEFVFYLIGRRIRISSIAHTNLDARVLAQTIEEEFGPYCSKYGEDEILFKDILADVPAYQNRLADVWQRYWDEYFGTVAGDLPEYWERGLAESERILTHRGSEALFEHLLGKKGLKLPEELPPGQLYTDIVFVPLHLIPHRAFMFYGYGNITVLYDCEYTEARVAQIETSKEEALAALRALGDNTRLSILRLVALHEGMINGKKIAAKLNMSASAVSRHLAQLRDSGLIVEEPLDHRNITYRMQKDTIASLPNKLFDYLYA